VRDLNGAMQVWLDIGTPSPERLHLASKTTPRVAYTHKDVAQFVARLRSPDRAARSVCLRLRLSYKPGKQTRAADGADIDRDGKATVRVGRSRNHNRCHRVHRPVRLTVATRKPDERLASRGCNVLRSNIPRRRTAVVIILARRELGDVLALSHRRMSSLAPGFGGAPARIA
jgi:hypothetical protein